MPVSSTFSTSAPRSASNSEQKPPGRSRVRSRTLTSARGSPSPRPLAIGADLDREVDRVGDEAARMGLVVQAGKRLGARRVPLPLDPRAQDGAGEPILVEGRLGGVLVGGDLEALLVRERQEPEHVAGGERRR